MTDTSDHPPGERGLASLHLPAGETGGSHLAHWPPPQRGQEVRHGPAKHLPAEPDPHARPHHGLSLTRSAFKGDDDE